ncbi:hypothetical protein SEVIR_9G263438v4 [Setaria viridis]
MLILILVLIYFNNKNHHTISLFPLNMHSWHHPPEEQNKKAEQSTASASQNAVQVALLCLGLSDMLTPSPSAVRLPHLPAGMLLGVSAPSLGDGNLAGLPPRGDRLTSSSALNWSSDG